MQKNPRKKSPFKVENAWKQKMFTTMEKSDLILKTPLGFIQYADVWSPFYENV